MTDRFICGDALEELRKLPARSVDMCMTSPPYWGLRDYGLGEGELGLELSPELYIDRLTEIFNEVKRVLKRAGTLWLNIGDTYWSAKGSCHNPGGGKASIETGKKEKGVYPLNRGNKTDVPNLPQKSLTMIPERLAWSLVQAGWILRNKIIWFKPNSMPASVKDRFNNRWEILYLFSKTQKYYFDLDAVREPHHPDSIARKKRGISPDHKYADKPSYGGGGGLNKPRISLKDKRKGLTVPGQEPHAFHRKRHSGYYGADGEYLVNPLGKNPGDVWVISTQPFKSAHYAVFPEALCERPIKAGCPKEVCKKCGKARERIIKRLDTGELQKMPSNWDSKKGAHGRIHREGRETTRTELPLVENKTIGWTVCKCNAGFEPGIVLDPFAGAGTIGLVAKALARGYILIEIKKEYYDMAKKRIGRWLF